MSVIDPDFIWPDDRFELLSRLSSAAWFPKVLLMHDLGWDENRLNGAIAMVREMAIRVNDVEGSLRLSVRSRDLALIAVRGYELRMDEEYQ